MKPHLLLSLCVALAVNLSLSRAEEKPSSDAEFKSPAAKSTTARYSKATRDAFNRWRTAMTEADNIYLTGLKDALAAVMKSQDLDEANRLNARIKLVHEHLAKLASSTKLSDLAELDAALSDTPPAIRTMIVYANKLPQVAGAVKQGQRLAISAKGAWTNNTSKWNHKLAFGPDGDSVEGGIEHNGYCVLTAFIGKTAIRIGREQTIEIPEDGVLRFGINDSESESAVADNAGQVTVTITQAP
jgi:hypothetical protein